MVLEKVVGLVGLFWVDVEWGEVLECLSSSVSVHEVRRPASHPAAGRGEK